MRRRRAARTSAACKANLPMCPRQSSSSSVATRRVWRKRLVCRRATRWMCCTHTLRSSVVGSPNLPPDQRRRSARPRAPRPPRPPRPPRAPGPEALPVSAEAVLECRFRSGRWNIPGTCAAPGSDGHASASRAWCERRLLAEARGVQLRQDHPVRIPAARAGARRAPADPHLLRARQPPLRARPAARALARATTARGRPRRLPHRLGRPGRGRPPHRS